MQVIYNMWYETPKTRLVSFFFFIMSITSRHTHTSRAASKRTRNIPLCPRSYSHSLPLTPHHHYLPTSPLYTSPFLSPLTLSPHTHTLAMIVHTCRLHFRDWFRGGHLSVWIRMEMMWCVVWVFCSCEAVPRQTHFSHVVVVVRGGVRVVVMGRVAVCPHYATWICTPWNSSNEDLNVCVSFIHVCLHPRGPV